MGIMRALKDATTSTLLDQWKEIVTADEFDEHTLVAPGIIKTKNNGRGTNSPGSDGVISNGSIIYVPDNTAAVLFNQNAIEYCISKPGGYEYKDGDPSVFNGDGILKPITSQIKKRFGFGGISPDKKQIAFVNLREIRSIPFGTHGPLLFTDVAYGVDFEVHAYGMFSIRITDCEKFVRNYLPPTITTYSLDDEGARYQIVSEFLQSFSVAINSLSAKCRVSQLPSMENEIVKRIMSDNTTVALWGDRFGFALTSAAIQSIELSDSSKELLKKYASKKIDLSAYDDISQKSSDISAQQKIADGIKENGFGEMGGMLFGMNFVNGLGTKAEARSYSVEEQLDILKKLKEALDAGIITQEEFDAKKKEVLHL